MYRPVYGEIVIQWCVIGGIIFNFIYKHSLIFETIKGIVIGSICISIILFLFVISVWINKKTELFKINNNEHESESDEPHYGSDYDPCEDFD